MTAPATAGESEAESTDSDAGDAWPADAYDRPDGVGVRDRLLVLPSVICSHQVADRIADAVDGAVSASHDHGCSQLGADETQTERTLRGVATNPNVAGAVVVGLGCEGVQSDALAATLDDDGVPVRELSIQGVGGSAEAVDRGVDHADALIERGARTATAGLGDLTVGVVSGDVRDSTVERADPLVGAFVDRVVEAGGRAVVAGTERLRPHADAVEGTDRVAEALRGRDAPRTAGPARRAAERSVDEVTRAWGGRPIRELVPYGARAIHDSGVALVDAPSRFAEAATGLAAAGAHVVIHATADGVPTGHPIVPVCKVTGDGETYAALEGDIDVDARTATADDLVSTVGRAVGGERTCAERHGLTTFAITRVGPSM